MNRGVEENCDKEIVIFPVHDSGMKLTELNERICYVRRLLSKSEHRVSE